MEGVKGGEVGSNLPFVHLTPVGGLGARGPPLLVLMLVNRQYLHRNT